ncbi:hypothetical protein [Lacticaseibacillus jixiensis]|uniref:hypothetical protein n=1 Tax=Lacticaseibacillus jixiensis TaxID=3231926 RepID=UPI0036F2E6E2
MKVTKFSYALLSAVMLAGAATPSVVTFASTETLNSSANADRNTTDIENAIDGEVNIDNLVDYVKVNVSASRFELASDALTDLTNSEYDFLSVQIALSNAHIATMIEDGFEDFFVADPGSDVVYIYNNGILSPVLPSLDARYTEGVTKVTVHWNFVRIYLSRTAANRAVNGMGLTGAASYLTTSQIKATASKMFTTPFPGGVWFDINFFDVGVSAIGGLAGVATAILLDGINSHGYQ